MMKSIENGRAVARVLRHVEAKQRSKSASSSSSSSSQTRCFRTATVSNATPMYPTRPGPPPNPPRPSAEFPGEKVEQARKKAKLLQLGQQLKTNPAKPATALQKRFWKDVHVVKAPEGWQVYLDKRPVRAPNTKDPLTVPHTKKALATAIALEWDSLVSAQQALKNHNIPLTSLTSRAVDVALADRDGKTDIRESIVKMLLGYLSTDTLLCWAPEKNLHEDFEQGSINARDTANRPRSLRQLQEQTAKPIIAHLTTFVWPGVQLTPALEEDSILPQAQPEMSVQIIRGWLTGLPAFELAALERGVLASKSLLVATRVLVDWSEEFADIRESWKDVHARFGIEEAAQACSLEVSWQTRMWGEVEDTHDVDKEDVRRQLGSAVLLIHGQDANI